MTIPCTRLLLALALMPGMLAAQAATTAARTGVIFESYSFGSGLAFNRISELTIPIGVTQRVGGRLVIDVSTAFASASVSEAAGGATRSRTRGLSTPICAPRSTRLPASWCSISSAPSRPAPRRFRVRRSPCSVPRALVFSDSRRRASGLAAAFRQDSRRRSRWGRTGPSEPARATTTGRATCPLRAVPK